jgi:hypothetical protein
VPLSQDFSARFCDLGGNPSRHEVRAARSLTRSSADRFGDPAHNDRGGTLPKASARGQSVAITVATEGWIPLYERCLPEVNDRR